ncbi:MAG: DUF4173 domain-containing protein [Ardenticatenaceae bacterium]|nr:DUF4173 domain-containing protein [Ardenticatenaceae bacterium]
MKSNSTRQLLIFALLGGLFFTYFFIGKRPGISVPLFLIGAVSTLYSTHRDIGRKIARKNLWLAGPIILSGLAFLFYENLLVLLLNLALILIFSLLWAHFFTGGDPSEQSLWSYLFIPPHVVCGQIERPFPAVQSEIDVDVWQKNLRHYVLPTVRGILLATPLLLLFVLLMFSADVVFAQLLNDLLQIQIDIAIGRWLRNGLITLGSGWLIAGWMMYAVKPYADREIYLPERLLRQVSRRFRLGPIETNTILSLIALLFAAFVFVQFAYLFGGLTHLDVQGLSYSEYARRGFFELIAVAVLALGVILVLRKVTRFINPKGSFYFRLLSSFLVGFTLVMLVSAFKRMYLYEQAFGFTMLRLSVHICIFWLGIILLWFVYTLWTAPQRFALGALLSILGFVLTLNLIHPERFVVNQNFKRYAITGELDVGYLSTLSADATPTLLAQMSNLTIAPVVNCQRSRPIGSFDRRSLCSSPPDLQFLEDRLNQQRLTLEEEAIWVNWPAAHIGRYRARQTLQTYFNNQP